MEECEGWTEEREALIRLVEEKLDLPSVMRKIMSRKEAWSAFAKFCKKVMLAKEDAKRTHRREAPHAGFTRSQGSAARKRSKKR